MPVSLDAFKCQKTSWPLDNLITNKCKGRMFVCFQRQQTSRKSYFNKLTNTSSQLGTCAMRKVQQHLRGKVIETPNEKAPSKRHEKKCSKIISFLPLQGKVKLGRSRSDEKTKITICAVTKNSRVEKRQNPIKMQITAQ